MTGAPAGVQRAIQRTGYADYWELYRRNAMPAETRAYVPQILAAVIMAKNPERYGLTDKLVPSPACHLLTPSRPATPSTCASSLTSPRPASQEIVALNPSLLRLSTPRDISFDLHIPPGTNELFNDRLKDIPADRRASWRFHIVKPGETRGKHRHRRCTAHATEIAETNGITAQDPMGPGDELVVPVQSSTAGVNPQRYTPRRGDTLITVADRFNVSVEELRLWNRLSSSAIRPGRALYVAEPVRLGGFRAYPRPSRSRQKGQRRASAREAAHASSRGRGKRCTRLRKKRAGTSSANGATSAKRSTKKRKSCSISFITKKSACHQ